MRLLTRADPGAYRLGGGRPRAAFGRRSARMVRPGQSWPSAAGSRRPPAGRSRNSSGPLAATGPSRSAQAPTPSPPLSPARRPPRRPRPHPPALRYSLSWPNSGPRRTQGRYSSARGGRGYSGRLNNGAPRNERPNWSPQSTHERNRLPSTSHTLSAPTLIHRSKWVLSFNGRETLAQ
jgi:hypothetical protein